MYLEAQVPGFPWTRVCISHYKAAKRWVFQWYCTLLIIIVNIVRKQWRVESRHLQFKRYPSPIQKIQCAIIWSIKWNLQCTIIWKLCSAKLHENLSYCNLNSLPIKLLNWMFLMNLLWIVKWPCMLNSPKAVSHFPSLF